MKEAEEAGEEYVEEDEEDDEDDDEEEEIEYLNEEYVDLEEVQEYTDCLCIPTQAPCNLSCQLAVCDLAVFFSSWHSRMLMSSVADAIKWRACMFMWTVVQPALT